MWETLCLDMTRLILGKLSFRDVARAAATCRELRRGFHDRSREEQQRLISIAEDIFGKDELQGFVRALNHLMSNEDAYRSLQSSKGKWLAIDAAGGSNLVTQGDMARMRKANGRLLNICKPSSGPLKADLIRNPSPGQDSAHIQVFAYVLSSRVVHLVVRPNKKETTASIGLLLALCAENPEASPASWRFPLSTTTFRLKGCWGSDAVREVMESVRRLRSLAESFRCYKSLPRVMPPALGRGELHSGQPLGHLKFMYAGNQE
jgi:hypothetical protein